MATRRGQPLRFDRSNRIRARDNIKVKRIAIMTPYVLHGKALNIKDNLNYDVLEAVVPVTGSIHNVVVNLKDSSGELISTLYKNDIELKENPYGQLVEEGDILKYSVKPKESSVVALKVFCSIVILPTYDKRFVLKTKVDKK